MEKIQKAILGNKALIIVSGNIVMHDADKLFEAVEEVVSENGLLNITVDVTDVGYVDSYGLGIMIKCHNFIEQASVSSQGAKLVFIVNDELRQALSIVKLEDFLNITMK